jgi:uncharacterized protein (DUF983 family)
MLTILEETQLMMQGKREYICPGCQGRIFFFRWLDKNCAECGVDLPNLYSIRASDDGLLEWHFSSEDIPF